MASASSSGPRRRENPSTTRPSRSAAAKVCKKGAPGAMVKTLFSTRVFQTIRASDDVHHATWGASHPTPFGRLFTAWPASERGASPVTGAARAGQSWCLTRAIAGKTRAVRLNASRATRPRRLPNGSARRSLLPSPKKAGLLSPGLPPDAAIQEMEGELHWRRQG